MSITESIEVASHKPDRDRVNGIGRELLTLAKSNAGSAAEILDFLLTVSATVGSLCASAGKDYSTRLELVDMCRKLIRDTAFSDEADKLREAVRGGS